MGKIFSNKNLIIKIATILVIVILFNFINPGISFGAATVLLILCKMLYLAQMYHY